MTPVEVGKRIVLATFGSPGDLFPFLAIGQELRQRGHKPTVASSEIYRDLVAAAGLDFAPVRPNRLLGQRDPDYVDRLRREHRSPGEIFREMFLPALRESLQDMLLATRGVDAVVSHTLVSAARLAAEARRVPWVSAVMQPMGYLSAYEPAVVGPPWLAAVLRIAGPTPTRVVMRSARHLTAAWTDDWHILRAELGLPPTQEQPLWEGQHSALRSLGLFPRMLGAPLPDWPPAARVTGFPFFAGASRTMDPALERFLASGEPPIVFTLGTTAVNEPGVFYEESARAARRLGRRAVLLVGPENRCAAGRQSDGVLALPYAAHALLFPHALAVVHQGGIGTLAEGMRAGKPMLVMPYGHDQADNAWRATRLGVARVIPRRRYRADIVARELARLFTDPHIVAATARVARDVSQEQGATRAADLIERALR
jgi:UDP:flavonoid glycosyltransferase YjiC (YdhE family)